MFKKIALISVGVTAIAVAAILGIAATKPDVLKVERSETISASAEEIFPKINNLRNWSSWSPYEELDPKMKRTFGGPEAGPGAAYSWDGNDDVGQGSMEITKIEEPNKVYIDLHFVRPFKGDNKVVFSLEPEEDATKVTWAMEGESPFICKVMQVFMDMDEMCGRDFSKGLRKLRDQVEEVDSTEAGESIESELEESSD
ncbi:MAG: SRPBCC family protein [Candidatus Melainabacteria bacterium]|nr:SRPBCC family protein [Candidatus Melainabacteria bacterium]